MKDYKELTTEELANLTDEQVEQYIKLICAQEGIKILQVPQEPVKSADLNKDCEVYTIPTTNLCFSDINEAKEILESLRKMKSLGTIRYLSNSSYFEVGLIGYDNKPVDLVISTEVHYSKKKANEKEKALKEYGEAKKKYDQELKEYYDNKDALDEATKEFLGIYKEAVKTMDNRRRLSNLFYKEYLPLAESNIEIAMGFLKKAYIVTEEDEQYIFAQKK